MVVVVLSWLSLLPMKADLLPLPLNHNRPIKSNRRNIFHTDRRRTQIDANDSQYSPNSAKIGVANLRFLAIMTIILLCFVDSANSQKFCPADFELRQYAASRLIWRCPSELETKHLQVGNFSMKMTFEYFFILG